MEPGGVAGGVSDLVRTRSRCRRTRSSHPDSPLNCAEQRNGKVVFLGPSGADCTVSDEARSSSFTHFGFWECSTAEGLGETWAELRACAKNNFARDLDPDIYHQNVYIDGKRLRHQRDWVTHTTPGEIIDFPKDNIWGAEPGPSKSVTKGFLFILRPLSEGRHRIVIETKPTLSATRPSAACGGCTSSTTTDAWY